MYVFSIIGFILCLGVVTYSFIAKSKTLEKKEKERFLKRWKEKKEGEKSK